MAGRVAALASVALLLVVARPAFAGPPTDQLRGAIDRVIAVLDDPALKAPGRLAERQAAVRKVAEGIFDVRETASRALGRHWRARTEAEQIEFVGLFADLLEQAYLGRLELSGGERVVYLGESISGDYAVVRTKVLLPKTGTEVPVDYRMLRRDERWLVYDVAIEGISLVANYRSQFTRIIEEGSYQELVKRMKAKQAERSGRTAAERQPGQGAPRRP